MSPSTLAQTHEVPSHPLNVGVHPLNEAKGDKTMVLASSIRKNKHFHESDHSDSDKEVAKIQTPMNWIWLKKKN